MTCHHVSRDNSAARVVYFTDKQSGKHFLIDTGAGLSVLPPEDIDRPHKGNGTEIPTYGERAMKLGFGLGHVYNWVFHVPDVKTPILVIDFLVASQFNINVHNASITDKCTMPLSQQQKVVICG